VRLIWAALIGFVVFGEQPLIWSWIGGAVIMVGVIMLIKKDDKEEDEKIQEKVAIASKQDFF
jgi:drug/metabolite transporter (DMT)-like permease